MKKLTEAEETERGALLAKVLKLRRDPRNRSHWFTTWGSKTDLGLYRTVKRLLKDGKDL